MPDRGLGRPAHLGHQLEGLATIGCEEQALQSGLSSLVAALVVPGDLGQVEPGVGLFGAPVGCLDAAAKPRLGLGGSALIHVFRAEVVAGSGGGGLLRLAQEDAEIPVRVAMVGNTPPVDHDHVGRGLAAVLGEVLVDRPDPAHAGAVDEDAAVLPSAALRSLGDCDGAARVAMEPREMLAQAGDGAGGHAPIGGHRQDPLRALGGGEVRGEVSGGGEIVDPPEASLHHARPVRSSARPCGDQLAGLVLAAGVHHDDQVEIGERVEAVEDLGGLVSDDERGGDHFARIAARRASERIPESTK